MNKIEVKQLKENKEFIEEVTELICEEFGTPDYYKFYESIINHSLGQSDFPITFIAVKNNKLVGTVGLWRADLMSRQDLYPWLAALYVKEEYRNMGIAQSLQDKLIDYCKFKNINEVFVWADVPKYYEKTGWSYFESGVTYDGEKAEIYNKII